MGFDKQYWIENYSEPETMDGIVNAKEHILYLYSLFQLEEIEINSIVDLGCGFGNMFCAALRRFRPKRALGLEPSEFAYEKAHKKILRLDVRNWNVKLQSIKDWLNSPNSPRTRFDLAFCNSVLQYLPDNECDEFFKRLSQRVKYLYLSVPTDNELKLQIKDFGFLDKFAIPRDKSFYLNLIGEHFTIVSSRLLESKFYFNESNSKFTDLLFRL